MREADLQKRLTRFLKGRVWKEMMVDLGLDAIGVEVKFSRGQTIPYSEIKEGQVVALLHAGGSSSRALVHKISDSAIGYKPFDCFVMYGCAAWFIFGYENGKKVYAIEVSDVEAEMYTDGGRRRRGSFKMEWAEENAVMDLSKWVGVS